MRRLARLIHTLGRWRGTHCNACGRRIPFEVSGIAIGGHRIVHLTARDCARNVTP